MYPTFALFPMALALTLQSDEPYSLCSVSNFPAFANLSNCCESAPVQYTPDYCRKFCAYDFSKASQWFQCVGGDLEASCQEAGALSTTMGGSQTNPTTISRAAPTSTRSKAALLLALLCIVNLYKG